MHLLDDANAMLDNVIKHDWLKAKAINWGLASKLSRG